MKINKAYSINPIFYFLFLNCLLNSSCSIPIGKNNNQKGVPQWNAFFIIDKPHNHERNTNIMNLLL